MTQAIEESWELVKDVAGSAAISDLKLELFPYLDYGEQLDLSNDEIEERLNDIRGLGLYHAEYLLVHQDEISSEWQEHHLLFPGTIMRGTGQYGGVLYMPCMWWNRDRWRMFWYACIPYYYGSLRVVRSK